MNQMKQQHEQDVATWRSGDLAIEKPAHAISSIAKSTVRRVACCAAIVGAACLASGASPQSSPDRAGQVGADIEQMRVTLDKWVETRRVISQERRDWTIGRDMLNERIELVRREIDAVRTKVNDAQASITEADRKRAELIEENDRVKAAVGTLGETILTLESRTRTLLTRLPEPLRDRIKPLSQRLPDDPATTKLSLSERYLNVVGMMNEINKFNREITMTSEVRSLPNGTSAEVTAVYIGIGQGYYVGAQNTIAGVGSATSDGWVWKPADEAAAGIAKAIAILKNEQVATFVRLPIAIH